MKTSPNPWSDTQGAFDLHFSPDAARRIRNRRWSATQEIEEHADSSLTLTMETSGRDDVVRWALSFGSDAEILKPDTLRAMIRNCLLDTLRMYQSER